MPIQNKICRLNWSPGVRSIRWSVESIPDALHAPWLCPFEVDLLTNMAGVRRNATNGDDARDGQESCGRGRGRCATSVPEYEAHPASRGSLL